MKNLKIALALLGVMSLAAACNKGSKGTLADGATYEIYTSKGGNKPQIGDFVTAELYVYKDTTLLMTTITEGQPARLQIDTAAGEDKLFAALMSTVRMMSKGDSATVSIPVEGANLQGFQGGKLARVTIVLKEVQTEEAYVNTLPQEQQMGYKMMKETRKRAPIVQDSTMNYAKNVPANAVTTASGLKYVVLKEGNGPVAKTGFGIVAHYYGVTSKGVSFDNSYERGQPFQFIVGKKQVISAWDEAFTLLKQGTTAIIYAPAKLAYGDKGNGAIEPNSDLVFYVEVLAAVDIEAEKKKEEAMMKAAGAAQPAPGK